ncbi:ATP-binding protein [Allocoleopsis sp.]|uniref:ATP-binding protein n=1 Tax=Allocoleopsis sp. TaxID=3088169 RepID=UPI002FD0639C
MELIILIGLQASGKSTFLCQYWAVTHELVSKDLMRNNKNRARRQAQLVESALQAERAVVVDNTNPTVEERASLIQIGKLYDAQILGYYFQSNVSDCLERNEQRTGKARVPDVGIYATAKKLVPPSYAEGFHQLFHVKMTGNSAFEVRAWTVTDG